MSHKQPYGFWRKSADEISDVRTGRSSLPWQQLKPSSWWIVENRDNKNYGQKRGVLHTIRSEMVHRFQIYKNHQRRCCISGIIVLNVRLRPLSVASALKRRRRSNTPVQRNQHGEGDTNFSHFNKASFQLYKTS